MYSDDEKVKYVRLLTRNNYNVGMRVNTIHSTELTTADSIHQHVVKTKNSYSSGIFDSEEI